MTILFLLLIVWVSYLVAKNLRAQPTLLSPVPARPRRTGATPPSDERLGAGGQDEPTWSALDDRQLTRLLTDSAPRTTTD